LAQITFKFDVNAQGVFTYTVPPLPASQNWPFSGDDNLLFECPKGPFTLRLRRTDLAPGAGALPDIFGGQVPATQKLDGVWVAAVPKILDGLEREERKSIWRVNGFIAKYRYVVGVVNGTGVAVDDSHSGIHTC